LRASKRKRSAKFPGFLVASENNGVEETVNSDKKPAPSKLATIRNGRGEVTGHIRLYWAVNLQQYVSIPGYEAGE